MILSHGGPLRVGVKTRSTSSNHWTWLGCVCHGKANGNMQRMLRVSFPLCFRACGESNYALAVLLLALTQTSGFISKQKRRHGSLAVFRNVPRRLHSPCVRLHLPCHLVPAAPIPQGPPWVLGFSAVMPPRNRVHPAKAQSVSSSAVPPLGTARCLSHYLPTM